MTPDTQWPSEDEDFDAVTDSKSIKAATATEPERQSVSVVSDEELAPDAATEPEVEKAVEKPEHPKEPETEPESAPETVPEPESKPEPQPEVSHPEADPVEPATVSTVSTGAKPPRGHLIVEIILVAALAGVTFWAFTQYSHNKTLTTDNASLKKQITTLNSNPQIAIQKQTEILISKVGALMQLPTGESPTVANVSDVTAARKQSAFFNNAQNGDKVLMYVKAGQAILYRPDTNKIILVAPLTFNSSSTSPKTTQ